MINSKRCNVIPFKFKLSSDVFSGMYNNILVTSGESKAWNQNIKLFYCLFEVIINVHACNYLLSGHLHLHIVWSRIINCENNNFVIVWPFVKVSIISSLHFEHETSPCLTITFDHLIVISNKMTVQLPKKSQRYCPMVFCKSHFFYNNLSGYI